jgi:hypothetical protein
MEHDAGMWPWEGWVFSSSSLQRVRNASAVAASNAPRVAEKSLARERAHLRTSSLGQLAPDSTVAVDSLSQAISHAVCCFPDGALGADAAAATRHIMVAPRFTTVDARTTVASTPS